MLWWLLWGCVSDIPPEPADPCPVDAPNTVVTEVVTCRERVPDGGDGTTVDTWIASPSLRAVVRHPVASHSLPGLGGGTLVDVAPWGMPDAAIEWVPLVDGGWLDVDRMDIEPDGVVASGTVRSLPGERIAEGALRTVRWRLMADEPVIALEGADGLWMHPQPGTTRLGPALVHEGVQVVTDGVSEEDLGGVVRIADVTRIAVAPLGTEAWLDHPTTPLRADLTGATTLALNSASDTARVPVDGAVDWVIPASFTAVRGEAPGRAASPWRAIDGSVVADAVGDPGTVWVSTQGGTPPISVRWQHEDGRSGRALTDNDVVVLPTGAGRVDISVHDGPASLPVAFQVDVAAGATVPVRARIQPRFDSDGFVPVQWLSDSERDPSSRRPDHEHLLDAAHQGSPFTVLAPRHDVADADIDAVIRLRNGTRITSADGWSVAAWPYPAHPRRSGHGAPIVAGRTPEDGLSLAAQSPTLNRLTLVDAEWLRQADPSTADPFPTGVVLNSEHDLSAWFRWLDAGARIVPAGPLTWLPVPEPSQVMAVEAERAWLDGLGTASTEGRIDLRIDGRPAGSTVPDGGEHTASITVHTGGALTDACLYAQGKQGVCWSATAGRTYTVTVPQDVAWAVAAAKGPDDVAVTAPVWFGLAVQ